MEINCYTQLDNNHQIIKAITDQNFTYNELPALGKELELKTNLCNFYVDMPFLIFANDPVVSSYIVASLVMLAEAQVIFVAPNLNAQPTLVWDTMQSAEGSLLI